jgi:ubiquinone/menaquinone biosynthesis C-methylase UbiE
MEILPGEPLVPHVRRIWSIFLNHHARVLLDVGCGYGWFGKHRPPHVEVVGVDLDEAKLRIAAKYERVVKADVCCLPFKNSCFDGALASHILEHVSNDLKAMSEINRVLRRGGCPNRGSAYSMAWCQSGLDPSPVL